MKNSMAETQIKKPVQPANKQAGKSAVTKSSSDTGKAKSNARKTRRLGIWTKDIILGVINLVFLLGLTYLLTKLPIRASELKTLRNLDVKTSNTVALDTREFDIESSKEKSDRLKSLFQDEQGIIEFVNEVEKLKVDGGVVDLYFASANPVRDKTNSFGVPIVIQFAGSWEAIDNDLQSIQNLPYLFRPIEVEIRESTVDGVVELEYGGFLYVDKSLEKN